MADKEKSAKKRKQTDPSTLEEVANACGSGMSVFARLSDYLDSALAKGKSAIVYTLLCSIHKADAVAECSHTVPASFGPYTITREADGKIIGIKDTKEKKKLSDEKLGIVKIITAAKAYGASTAILEQSGEVVSALFVPDCIRVEEQEVSGDSDDSKVKAYVYALKRQHVMYTTSERIIEALRLPYVKIGMVSKLIDNLNQADKGNPDVEISKLTDLAAIQAAISKKEKTKKATGLLSILMKMALVDAEMEAKVEAFEKFPMSSFARDLGLGVMYTNKLFTKNKQLVQGISYQDLEDDAVITMTTTPISENEYNSILAVPTVDKVTVYEETEHGTLRGGKWIKAASTFGMPKALVSRLYTAIANQNGGKKPAVGDSPSEIDSSDESYETIN